MAETPTRETQEFLYPVDAVRAAYDNGFKAGQSVDVAALRALVEDWEMSANANEARASLLRAIGGDLTVEYDRVLVRATLQVQHAQALAALLPPVPPEKG